MNLARGLRQRNARHATLPPHSEAIARRRHRGHEADGARERRAPGICVSLANGHPVFNSGRSRGVIRHLAALRFQEAIHLGAHELEVRQRHGKGPAVRRAGKDGVRASLAEELEAALVLAIGGDLCDDLHGRQHNEPLCLHSPPLHECARRHAPLRR